MLFWYFHFPVQDLRKKYAGAVPLPTQEKFSKQMINLQNDKQKIEDQLKEVRTFVTFRV